LQHSFLYLLRFCICCQRGNGRCWCMMGWPYGSR